MNPKVSVITVCYNAEEFIENAINSVLEQTYKNLEYIVIDGASTDSTVAIVNKYKDKINYFLSEPDNGMYEAMNKGIKASSGEIFYFLNSDDVFHDKYVVANSVKLLQEDMNVELIYGAVIIINPDTKASFLQAYGDVTRPFFIKSAICQQAIFYRKSLFDKVGLFDEKYKIVGDYEFNLRAFYKYDIKKKYVPQVMAIFRDGGIGCSEKHSELHKEERNDAFFRHFSKFEYYKYQLFLRTLSKIRILSN
ncbi:glycosyltransferase family 2 protein [Methanosarcina sp.]|uniref:glycosyltransferase family 2 protein n=1 Tax=Methanosarcina sp. TaxID=2213 RepID=UPI003C74AE54